MYDDENDKFQVPATKHVWQQLVLVCFRSLLHLQRSGPDPNQLPNGLVPRILRVGGLKIRGQARVRGERSTGGERSVGGYIDLHGDNLCITGPVPVNSPEDLSLY